MVIASHLFLPVSVVISLLSTHYNVDLNKMFSDDVVVSVIG